MYFISKVTLAWKQMPIEKKEKNVIEFKKWKKSTQAKPIQTNEINK